MKHKAAIKEFPFTMLDFRLSAEETLDGGRIERERQEAEQAGREAEKQQTKMKFTGDA